ncbi:MAG: hypothetical protein HQK51_09615 [Oligoflexia bacterium]|nr:hypothetical protein [Oligoflexia bacterium]
MKKVPKKFITIIFSERLGHFINEQIEKIERINRKYAVPKVTMTPTARRILMVLRFYLIFLVGVLVYKFWTVI